jgi:hypothetical protein
MNWKAISVICVALIFPLSMGWFAHRYQEVHSRQYKLAFSEIEEIEKSANNLNSLNHYLPLVNDTCMKILECSNTAVKRTTFLHSYTHMFASELDLRQERSLKIYKYDLSNLLGKEGYLLKWSDPEKNEDLKQLSTVFMKANSADNSLGPVWKVAHEDVYHTEFYTTTSTDSNGNTTTETHTRQVYDYTIHTYEYHPENNSRAFVACDALIASSYPESLLKYQVSKITHAENEYAMDTSDRRDTTGRLKEHDMTMLSSSWLRGSTIPENLCTANSHFIKIPVALSNWKTTAPKAKSVEYQNTNREGEEPGPPDYQIYNILHNQTIGMVANIGRIFNTINNNNAKFEQIRMDIENLVQIEKGNTKGVLPRESATRLRKNIINNTLAVYKTTFSNGFNPSYYSVLVVVLWALGGALIGGLIIWFAQYRYDIFNQRYHGYMSPYYRY